MNTLAKVEGHTSLVRDMSSHAIISNSDAEYNAYKSRREIEKRRQRIIEDQAKELETIKNEMSEIKQMLSMLINKG